MRSSHFPGEGPRNSSMDLLYGLIVQRSLLATAVSLGASATKLPTTPLTLRKNVIVFNNSDNVIYLGDSTVTTAAGFPVYPRAWINIQIEDGIDLYGIAAGAGNDVRLLEGA